MLTAIRSLTGPWHEGDCLHTDCWDPARCPGNKLSWVDDTKTTIRLVITHMKTSRWSSSKSINVLLTAELTRVFKPLLEEAIPKLTRCCDPQSPYIFINPNNPEQQLRPQEMSMAFRSIFPSSLVDKVPSPRQCRWAALQLLQPADTPIIVPCYFPSGHENCGQVYTPYMVHVTQNEACPCW